MGPAAGGKTPISQKTIRCISVPCKIISMEVREERKVETAIPASRRTVRETRRPTRARL